MQQKKFVFYVHVSSIVNPPTLILILHFTLFVSNYFVHSCHQSENYVLIFRFSSSNPFIDGFPLKHSVFLSALIMNVPPYVAVSLKPSRFHFLFNILKMLFKRIQTWIWHAGFLLISFATLAALLANF